MDPADWYLSATERGNASSRLDRGQADGRAWTEGNLVTPLVHGAEYFSALAKAVSRMDPGDLLLLSTGAATPTSG